MLLLEVFTGLQIFAFVAFIQTYALFIYIYFVDWLELRHFHIQKEDLVQRWLK